MGMTDLYTPVLLDHNANPDYKYTIENPTCSHDGVNPTCGDELTIQVRLADDGTIAEAAFTGHGCAVSQASADIMLGMIVGQKKEKALEMGRTFLRMIHGEATKEEIDSLEEASALKDIAHMPARVKCAMLGWRTLTEALTGKVEE